MAEPYNASSYSRSRIRRRLWLILAVLALVLLFAVSQVWFSESVSSLVQYQSRDALALFGSQQPQTCPEKLVAKYGKNRFNTPFQKDMKNIKFARGRPVDDAHYCNPSLSKEKVAVLVESRSDPYMIPSLLHFIKEMGDDWPFVIYHSKHNEDMLRSSRVLKKHIDSGKIQLHRLNLVFNDHDSVSVFLTHRAFYDNLAPAKHLFLFQLDSTICSNSQSKLEDFFHFAFIGAPISTLLSSGDITRYNGGFSLRDRDAFLEIIETVPEFQSKYSGNPFIFEDQWFSQEFHKANKYVLPTEDEAAQFAVESVYHPTPFGVHRPQIMVSATANDEQKRHLIDVWCPDMYAMTPLTGPETFKCRNNRQLPECNGE